MTSVCIVFRVFETATCATTAATLCDVRGAVP